MLIALFLVGMGVALCLLQAHLDLVGGATPSYEEYCREGGGLVSEVLRKMRRASEAQMALEFRLQGQKEKHAAREAALKKEIRDLQALLGERVEDVAVLEEELRLLEGGLLVGPPIAHRWQDFSPLNLRGPVEEWRDQTELV